MAAGRFASGHMFTDVIKILIPAFDETRCPGHLESVPLLTDAGRDRIQGILPLLGAFLLGGSGVSCRAEHAPLVHSGLANASAAVPVGTNLFLTGADDDNLIKLYRADVPGGPLLEFDPSPGLRLEGRSQEVNIEGAARVGDLVYWLGSHGRTKDGRARPNRQRLFATRLTESTNGVTLARFGEPCSGLLEALVTAPQLAPFHLRAAAQQAADTAGGLNLEGLAAMPDGNLLLGFRGPVPDGRALLVPLLNPAGVLTNEPPRLGEPVRLDLDGLGIRDLAWSGREYFILAGRSGHGGTAQLWRWAGGGAKPEKVEHTGFHHLNPEGIAIFGTPQKPHLLIVSDDGNQNAGFFRPFAPHTFRTVWVRP